jgi:hypothetical protein
MAKRSRYPASGFHPLGEPPARRHITAAAVTIVKGDALHDDGNGVATNATTAFAATFLGVAAADCASGGDCEYYPPDDKTQYIVKCGANNVLTATDIALVVDLEAVNTIDHNDTITEGVGFFIDEIDISTPAIAAATYGYAIGHFVVKGAQA